MQLIPRALTLAPKIAAIVDMVSGTLTLESNSDPSTDCRTIRFGTIEYGAMLFGPALCRVLEREAPRMRLSMLAMRRGEMLEQTNSYSTDVALGSFYGSVG